MTIPPDAIEERCESLPLVIVCDWLPPAFGAVGQYEMLRARTAASAGRSVTLIGLGVESGAETIAIGAGRLTIVRIAAKAPDKTNFLGRLLWVFSNNSKLLAATARATKAHRACEIKVTGSPPFLSYQMLLWRAVNRRRRITYRVTDFYPETAFAARRALLLRPLAPLIHLLRRSADRIEALSECQKRRLAESGVGAERVHIVRDVSPVQFGPEVRPAQRPFNANDVVILYSGNLGVAHDWRTFAEAYERHVRSGPNRVRLWLNAAGVGAAVLQFHCTTHGLPIHVSEPVPLQDLAGVLIAADAHLVLLGEPFWGYVFPSKIYACIDSRRPCLYIGPAESDIHALLSVDKRHNSLRNGDVDGVVAALAALSVAAHTTEAQDQ